MHLPVLQFISLISELAVLQICVDSFHTLLYIFQFTLVI